MFCTESVQYNRVGRDEVERAKSAFFPSYWIYLRIYSNLKVSHRSDDHEGGASALIRLLSSLRLLGGGNVIIEVIFIERWVVAWRRVNVKASGDMSFTIFRYALDFQACPTTLWSVFIFLQNRIVLIRLVFCFQQRRCLLTLRMSLCGLMNTWNFEPLQFRHLRRITWPEIAAKFVNWIQFRFVLLLWNANVEV